MVERLHRLLQWLSLGAVVGVACGAGSALFLWALGLATAFRTANVAIVFTLPIAGLLIGFLMERWGGPIRGGNNLIIDTVHEDSAKVPLRMAPMVLIGTVLTHLFGGSAGREGAAVQMGAALADEISHRLRVSREARIQLLAAGIAGGFGAVFGTPIAGAIFGLEVVRLGQIEYTSLLPAIVAAVVGDITAKALGTVHASYPPVAVLGLTPLVIGKWVVFAVAIALVAVVFVEATHRLRARLERYLPSLPWRMFCGGLAIVAMWQLVGTPDFLGLSLPMLSRSFTDPSLAWYTFALKLAFTVVTLAAGFLGGEVTPLFVIGAALGNALAGPLGLPLALAAGVGMAAMFAAASNTPLALSIMAVELLGVGVLPHVVIVCVVAYLLTGHRSIYPAQRLTSSKTGISLFDRPVPLRDMEPPGAGASGPPGSTPEL